MKIISITVQDKVDAYIMPHLSLLSRITERETNLTCIEILKIFQN